ncbi:DUF6471 domain-containing protein [Alteromonas sp. a30]|uniref:DUF6471 domain-containing protein n=1 Tax=Alteromonas sp. a30 TaxID=2730917 RepID=UPI002282D872|nr:DUF6471 domain-containing protein [Alteromonas sp. a30]MCY7295135.1 hypothetical protein [Alteromonas sp. a30]
MPSFSEKCFKLRRLASVPKTKETKKNKSESEKELDRTAALEIKRHIKAEMALRGLNYKTLAHLLTDNGRPITEQGLRNKVSKSSHRTTWYWHLMKTIQSVSYQATKKNSNTSPE